VIVQLLGDISGTRNGLDWPPRGSVVDLPDEEAIRLCEQQMARPYVEVTEARAVVIPVEDRRSLDGHALVPGVTTPLAPEPTPVVAEPTPELAPNRGGKRR
jgi:hypothetical protein